jgi:hypothetical protein
MGAQALANLRVRAGHSHGNPGPVSNMPTCHGEDLDRGRLGTLEHARQVADHTAGLLGQSQLDRPVQILDDIPELAGYLKDKYLTNGASSDLDLLTQARTSGRSSWELGWDVRRIPGWEQHEMVVEIFGEILRNVQLHNDEVTRFGGPGI